MKKIFLLFFIIIIFIFSCKEDKQTGVGMLSVHLTDAPADYSEVWIDVQGLQIKVSEDEEEVSGWQDLKLLTSGPIDLLTLTDGNSIWLANEELPASSVAQMRMILGPNNEIVVDGVKKDLDTPSAQQSGLKFKINATIEEGKTYQLFIDFDAEKSVVSKGNGTYSLKPVITVFTQEDAEEVTEQ